MEQGQSTILLAIDIQEGFRSPVWGERNNKLFEKNIELLFHFWRRHTLPLIHIQHCSTKVDSPLAPSSPGNRFMREAMPLPGEVVVQKQVHSAFIGTELETTLKKMHCRHLVLVGLCTDHCVSTTARMASDLGFQTTVVGDATATFDRSWNGRTRYNAEQVHEVSLASLSGEFAEICSTSSIVEGNFLESVAQLGKRPAT